MTALLAVSSVLSLLVLKSIFKRRRRNPRKLPLPPGPKGQPIVGNLFQLPQEYPWVTFREWSKTYGDLTYIEAMGQPLLIVGSLPVALDLLDKRGVNYSDRPSNPAFDVTKHTWSFAMMQYGPELRAHRKAFHEYFNASMIPKYGPIYDQEILAFLRWLHEDPADFLKHTQYLFGSIIMRIAYGFSDVEYNRSLISAAEEVMHSIAEITVPGRYLVNTFPILKYVPSWFPGAGWKRKMEHWATVNMKVLHDPFNSIKECVKSGQLPSQIPSMAVGLVEGLPEENHPDRKTREDLARNVCALTYIAGADTTIAAAHAMILALAMHPDVQRKAQAEIDSVVGPNRLPNLSDKPHLPYVNAIIKESTRWYTVGPMGIIHVSRNDDEYHGYFIPKGTYVFASTWAFMHDPDIFEDPMSFKPERYIKDGQLDNSVLDSDAAGFGYGRRICPGRSLSSNTLFLMVASLLATFDLGPAKDEAGNPIPLKVEMNSNMVAAPKPFKCSITLRSEKHLGLLQ